MIFTIFSFHFHSPIVTAFQVVTCVFLALTFLFWECLLPEVSERWLPFKKNSSFCVVVAFYDNQALQNQKKKTEEEKASATQAARDNKNLSEACENLQKKSSKLQHDLHTKDGQILNLQGLLARSKQALDGENGKVVLELMEHTLLVTVPF